MPAHRLVKGSAVGRAPAARWASAASAARIRSRPGGVDEVSVVAVRSRAAACRRARVRRRAAACSPGVGGRVPVIGSIGWCRRGPSNTARAAVAAWRRAVFSAARSAALPGSTGGGGVVGGGDRRGHLGDGLGQRGGVAGACGGRLGRAGGVGVGADDAAPAAAEPEHALGVGVGRWRARPATPRAGRSACPRRAPW